MAERLPWEQDDGAPHGVGICLSGGGLRAASFALGAVQGLQESRKLLFGPNAASHLAVVSGGSYLAATHALNAAYLAGAESASEEPPPLAEGSQEAAYVVGHGQYLKHWRPLATMALWAMLNFLAFAVLFLWTGVIFSGWVALAEELAGSRLDPPDSDLAAFATALAAAFVGGRLLLLRGLYKDGGAVRVLMMVAGLLALFAAGPTIVSAMQRSPAFSDLGWWFSDWHWAIATAIAALLIGLPLAVGRIAPARRAAGIVAAWPAARLPAAVGLVAFSLMATWMSPEFEAGTTAGWIVLWTALVGAVVMSEVCARASLHRLYRDRLASCFSVVRRPEGPSSVPAAAPLSDLWPPPPESTNRIPRLLVCATANVIWDKAHPARITVPIWRRSRRTHASFVFSHDVSGIPGVPGALYSTEQLERMMVPGGICRAPEPRLSLMTAVASTGAAISPAMGRKTSDLLRPVIALSNLRLGCWLPNPLSARTRRKVAEAGCDWRPPRRITVGYDEFVPELFGLHRSDAARVYISDGGHYDNLGLLALMRARCREIWCVDAEADAKGKADQLRGVLELAHEELEVDSSDFQAALDAFRASDRILGTDHLVGQLKYKDGSPLALTVIKLGVTAATKDEFAELRRADHPFPYHNTFWPPCSVMWYSQQRMDGYRRIGRRVALRAAASHPQG